MITKMFDDTDTEELDDYVWCCDECWEAIYTRQEYEDYGGVLTCQYCIK